MRTDIAKIDYYVKSVFSMLIKRTLFYDF